MPDLISVQPGRHTEIERLYFSGKRVINHAEFQITQLEQATSLDTRNHAAYLQVYCYCAMCSLILNRTLVGYRTNITTLEHERLRLLSQISSGADRAKSYRPIGSIYASLCLVVAIAVAADHPNLQRMSQLVNEYQLDSQGVKLDIMAAQARGMFARIHANASCSGSGFNGSRTLEEVYN